VGALGPVFRTYEPTRDRLVAVKVFRLDVTPEQAQALADELAHAAEAELIHPSIVEPIAAGVEGTVAYRAEEYVAAESLDAAITDARPGIKAFSSQTVPQINQLARNLNEMSESLNAISANVESAPKDKVAELSKWCSEAMLAPDLKSKWDLQGLTPVGSTSDEFAAHLRQQSADYAAVIRDANIKGE